LSSYVCSKKGFNVFIKFMLKFFNRRKGKIKAKFCHLS
jgi:hypothetical protein